VEKSCNVSFVIFWWRNNEASLKWHHNYSFQVRFRHNQFEKHNLDKSHNFRTTKSKVKMRWGGACAFWKFVTKLMHLDISQLKFSLKIWNLFIISSLHCEATLDWRVVLPLATSLHLVMFKDIRYCLMNVACATAKLSILWM